MTTILLARHGETDWNRERRWQGWADHPLNERGREQARALAERLDGVPLAAVYTSDLRRALETARVVGERHAVPVTPMTELREIDVGSWTGLRFDEIAERFPEAYRAVRARTGRGWEGGETYVDLRRRVLKAIEWIGGAQPGETVLVVTHSGPIRTIRARALGLDFATDRKAGARLDWGQIAAVAVADGVVRPADADLPDGLGAGRPCA